jgi:hypothetical protein
MDTALKSPAAPPGNDWDRRGLPAWTYHSEALLQLEIDEIRPCERCSEEG